MAAICLSLNVLSDDPVLYLNLNLVITVCRALIGTVLTEILVMLSSKFLCLSKILNYKNKERHTMHNIVSWPNPKQWQKGHTSDLMMIIRSSDSILSIITRDMGKLNTHSPIYCINDNWENWPNLRHTRDRIYLESILAVHVMGR